LSKRDYRPKEEKGRGRKRVEWSKIDEDRGVEERGRVFLVSIKQLSRLRLSFQNYGQYTLFTVLLLYVK